MTAETSLDAPGARLSPNPCANCGALFPAKTRGVVKIYCGPKCRTIFHRRSRTRGQVILPYVLAWRAGRGSGAKAKAAFAEVCAIADKFNAEDRLAKRPPMVDYVPALLKQGRYIDRKRQPKED